MQAKAFEQHEALERDHWWFRGRRDVYLAILREALEGRPRLAVDLGTGVGGWLPSLAELAERVVGLDSDDGAAGRARARGVAPVCLASAEHLPFRDDSCDLVTAFDVIEHVADDRAVLREVRRVLAPGGLFALSVPAHAWLYSNNDRVAHHQRRYSRSLLADRLTGAGLTIQRLTYANALLFPLIAPAVLGMKCAERLGCFGPAPEHTNLSLVPPGPLDQLCYRAFRAERRWSRRRDLPFGHSLVALARLAPPAFA